MGDLRDMLLKAGLVSAEQAKKVEEAKQVDQRPKGHGPSAGGPRPPNDRRPQGQQAGPQQGRPPRPERSSDATRPERASAAPSAPLSKEESQRLLKLAQAGKVEGRTRGQRRWYYVSRAGFVPCLEVSDEVVRDLEQGVIAIAESERGDAWLVTRECARELADADPSWVRTN